jgi:release factor glutamine methyltransferase
MTIRAALLQGQKLLEDGGVSVPRLTAEILLLHAISHDKQHFGERAADRAWLYAHAGEELREGWWIHYGRYLHERIGGKPTQYFTGYQEFYGREFRVTPDVLIPRPETEHVIEAALGHAQAATEDHRANPGAARAVARVLDVGAGSGAIAVTLALETKAEVFATDISLPALLVAQANARRLRADVSFLACDLGAAFPDHSFDLVVSNPPYVPERDSGTLQREVRDFEPAGALFAGADGLAVYRRLIPEARRLLRRGGWLVVELGDTAAEPVREMLAEWRDAALVRDLAGKPRVMEAMRP